uniref:Uncharacterized protein n=1 Tax=Escherichia coli TaxID=562 RepID=A0A7L8KA83_ECOLX|nr:hypothetical protein [Escherichia coli]
MPDAFGKGQIDTPAFCHIVSRFADSEHALPRTVSYCLIKQLSHAFGSVEV